MATLENVKTMIGLKDDSQDAALRIIINNAEARLFIWLKQHAGLDSIPSELNFIIEELTINRYNRIGSEGMQSESVEGHSVTFTEDDLAPYLSILETYKPKDEKKGKAVFF